MTDSERRIRWGVLGTANIGRAAVNPAIVASRNGRLVAVASRSADRARAFAEANGVPSYEGSYQALLDRDDVDAVYCPLPNSEHRAWTVRAAEHGKHVLCEKPLAVSSAECLAIDAAGRVNQVVIMEAFMYRFHPRIERLLSLVREGAIGELRMIRSAFTFRLAHMENIRMRPDLGGGALMDVGCYCVNLSRTVAGAEPIEAQAFAVWAPTAVDERLVGTLSFPAGVLAQFDSALTIERRELVEVVGTDGSLSLTNAFLPGTAPVAIELRRGRDQMERIDIDGVDEYRLMVEHFADCVLEGATPRYDAREASQNLRAIEALYRSAKSGGSAVAV